MSVRQASLSDLDQLVVLTTEFYAESGYPFNERRSADAFKVLLGDDRLGRVWLIEVDESVVGYTVVTLGYSLEYGGPVAFIDELFVRPAFRKAGLGFAAVDDARAFCLTRGVRALHLEVELGNDAARRLYRKAGFESCNRELLTMRLGDGR